MPETAADTWPKFDLRRWGYFTVLDEGDNFKVKRIEVLPGKRLSYQKHSQRAEHWAVVQGPPRSLWMIGRSLCLQGRRLTSRSAQRIAWRIPATRR